MAEAMVDVGGPGGICENCGHFAARHQGLKCLFPRSGANPCGCFGMKWNGTVYEMDMRTGPLRAVTPQRYRKKPVEIEAMQLTRDNVAEVEAFIGTSTEPRMLGEGITIRTLEGWMHASWGDWIIRGIQGEIYPCKPDIFEATYEAVPR